MLLELRGLAKGYGGEPVFHMARGAREPVRLSRIGLEPPPGESASDPSSGVVATFGPNVWIWSGGAFRVFDMRSW